MMLTKNGRHKLIKEVAALEAAAADGNTWGPETDADILARIVLDNLTPPLAPREISDLIDALDHADEDLRYRVSQGLDYDAADTKRIKAKLNRWATLAEKLRAMR